MYLPGTGDKCTEREASSNCIGEQCSRNGGDMTEEALRPTVNKSTV